MHRPNLIALAALSLSLALSANASGADKTKSEKKAAPPAGAPATGAPVAAAPDSDGEKVNVENIKEKYWARGDESELGVVQNRLYSKDHRFTLGVLGGTLISDPFLNTKTYGLTAGYYLTETWGLHLNFLKNKANPSSALEEFQNQIGATTNINPSQWYIGPETSASFLYGKLSLLGKQIIYYDMHLLGGVGATKTDNGTYFTPHVGLGQRVFLNKHFSVRVDFRLMYYRERILEKVVPTQLGSEKGTRNNWTNSITLGVDFFFGGGTPTGAPK